MNKHVAATILTLLAFATLFGCQSSPLEHFTAQRPNEPDRMYAARLVDTLEYATFSFSSGAVGEPSPCALTDLVIAKADITEPALVNALLDFRSSLRLARVAYCLTELHSEKGRENALLSEQILSKYLLEADRKHTWVEAQVYVRRYLRLTFGIDLEPNGPRR